MVKKIRTIMVCSLAIAACSKAEIEVPESQLQSIPICVEAETVSTKAFYDGLIACWEEGDQILALKGKHAKEKTCSDNGNAIGIDISTIDGSSAKFKGEVQAHTDNEDAYWYFAYPALGNTLKAFVNKKTEWFKDIYTYSNSVTINVGSTNQDGGKWRPVMFAATESKMSNEQTKQASFQVLSACIALKIFDHDGTTPKKIKKITITSDQNNLAGTFSNSGDPDTRIELSAANFSGSSNKITTENGITSEPYNGNEYRFNVPANVESGNLTIAIVDNNGKEITRHAASKALEPGHKRNLKIIWDEPTVDAKITITKAETTYSLYLANNPKCNEFENARKASLSASLTLSNENPADATLSSYGFTIDGKEEQVEEMSQNGEFSLTITGMGIGEHTVAAYAKINYNSKTVTFKSTDSTIVITGLPCSFNPPSKSTGWTGDGADWQNEYVSINSDDSINYRFYAPADINIKYITDWSMIGKTVSQTVTFKISDKDAFQHERTYGRTVKYGDNGSGILSQKNPTISWICDSGLWSTSYTEIRKTELTYDPLRL